MMFEENKRDRRNDSYEDYHMTLNSSFDDDRKRKSLTNTRDGLRNRSSTTGQQAIP